MRRSCLPSLRPSNRRRSVAGAFSRPCSTSIVAKSTASQFVRRMQPWDWVLAMSSGAGVSRRSRKAAYCMKGRGTWPLPRKIASLCADFVVVDTVPPNRSPRARSLVTGRKTGRIRPKSRLWSRPLCEKTRNCNGLSGHTPFGITGSGGGRNREAPGYYRERMLK
jgi:hypothetical protein